MSNHRVTIEDGARDSTAKVTTDGALTVTISPTLGVEERITAVPFTQFLTVNGDGVTTALNVNGSVTTPIPAFVTGIGLGDFYITTANVLIADSGSVQLNRFGADSALTNGVDLFYQITGADTILANVKTNFDFIRLGNHAGATGGKTDAYQLANTNPSNEDGYNPVLDLAKLSPYEIGIRIRQNSIDKFGVIIRDNLTGVSTFNIQLAGYVRVINEQGE